MINHHHHHHHRLKSFSHATVWFRRSPSMPLLLISRLCAIGDEVHDYQISFKTLVERATSTSLSCRLAVDRRLEHIQRWEECSMEMVMQKKIIATK